MKQELKELFKKCCPDALLQMYYRFRNPQFSPVKDTLCGRKVFKKQEASDLVFQTLAKETPCSIVRFGWAELEMTLHYMDHHEDSDFHFQKSYYTTGLFPETTESLSEFCKQSLYAVKHAEILGVTATRGDDRIIQNVCPNAGIIEVDVIGTSIPFLMHPWTRFLSGKKVLVIHPFETSIRLQYPKRKYLFTNYEVLPEFELMTMKTVQSAGIASKTCGFSDWQHALDSMKNQISSLSFDIALIGAGGYGMLLTEHCRSIGKQAIQMGGALQLLFGIKGRRWEKEYPPEFGKSLFNDYWINPCPEEKPAGANSIENGCYW